MYIKRIIDYVVYSMNCKNMRLNQRMARGMGKVKRTMRERKKIRKMRRERGKKGGRHR